MFGVGTSHTALVGRARRILRSSKNTRKKIVLFLFCLRRDFIIYLFFVPLFWNRIADKKSLWFTRTHTNEIPKIHKINRRRRKSCRRRSRSRCRLDIALVHCLGTASVVAKIIIVDERNSNRAHPFTSNLNDRIDCVLHSRHKATPRMACTRTEMPVGRRFEKENGTPHSDWECVRVWRGRNEHENAYENRRCRSTKRTEHTNSKNERR